MGDSDDTEKLPKGSHGWDYDEWHSPNVFDASKKCTCGWASTEYGKYLESWQHSDWCEMYRPKDLK